MRALRHSLIFLMTLLAVGAYAQEGAKGDQASLAGMLYASNFYNWTVPAGNAGQYSWSSRSVCTVSTGGVTFPAFVVGSPVLLVDQSIPANTEVVVPTQVILNSGCLIQINPVHPHSSFYFTSASFGLQEAINYSLRNSPSVVVLTPGWTTLGGTTSMVTNAKGNSNVSVLDERTSVIVPYAWDIPSLTYIAQPFGGGANLTPNAVLFALTSSTTRAATAADIGGLYAGTSPCFLNKNGTCSASTSTPAGVNQEVQINQSGVFGVDPFFLNNATTHNTLSRQFNNLPYASQYQSGGGSNGQANFLASAGANQVLIVDNGDGSTEVNQALLASTPDNTTILDWRSNVPNGTSGGAGFSVGQKNCTAEDPPFATATVSIPYCSSFFNYWSNSTGSNNTIGGYPLVVGSYRDGFGFSGWFAGATQPWTVTQGLAVNVADYAAGIENAFTASLQKNADGDINAFLFAGIGSGGQGTASSDQGYTGITSTYLDADVTTTTPVASTTGTGDRFVVPSPFPGTQFYSRWSSGSTDWALNLNAPVIGSTGSITGAYVNVNNTGSGMANGTYTVTCSGGGGSGGTLQAVVISGTINRLSGISVASPGSGYTSAPTCAGWTPGGNPATLIPTIGVAGTMLARAGLTPGSTYLQLLTVGGNALTPSTGDVVTTSSTINPTTAPGTYQSDTMTAVINNNHPLVAGIAWSADQSYPEPVMISNVSGGTTTGSTQTFTMSHQSPKQTGMNIYQGGTNGCFLQDANFHATGDLMCDFFFGAIDSTHGIIGKLSHGALNVNSLPNMYSTLTSGGNGYHVYAGTTVLGVAPVIPGQWGTVGGQPTLAYNVIPWHVGDYMAEPKPTGFDVTSILGGTVVSNSPSDNGDTMLLMIFAGSHFDGNTLAGLIWNQNTASFYQQHGGQLGEPGGIDFRGVFRNYLTADQAPADEVFFVNDGGAKMTWLAGSLGLVSDAPNNRWDIGGAGLKTLGPILAGTLQFSNDPSINAGNQVLSSNNSGSSFYSSLGSTPTTVDGIFGLQEVDAGVIRAGSTAPPNFFIAHFPTVGSTTYTWVATSETSSGGETLPGTPLVHTAGPTSLSGSNFYNLEAFGTSAANWINVYRRTGGGGTGLICHVLVSQMVSIGCQDTGQTAGAAEPTSDSSGVFTGPATAPSGSCSTIGWVLSQDGNVTFCNGSTWVAKGAGGGGVTQLIAGTGVVLSPAGGTGVVTVSSTGSGGGSVTNFLAPSASWPTWLVPTVTNATTTPSLTVSASVIPNSALANSSVTVNSVSCILGASCTVPVGVTSFSFTNGGGFTGTVTNATSTPALALAVDSTHFLPINTGSSSLFLNQAGTYTTPAGGGGNTASTSLTSGTLPVANGANSIINSLATDNGTTFGYTGTGGITAPSVTTTGSSNGFLTLTSTGSLPGAETTNQLLITVPNTVTHYTLELPGAQPTTGNTLLSCTAANPSVCTWVAASGGAGTVTFVGFTGGLISVATPTTTPAFTVAGTSGGIPYFSSASTWASSAAGTVNTTMLWGGAGNAPIAGHCTDSTVFVCTIAIESASGTATSAGLGLNGTAIGMSGVSGNLNLLAASGTRAILSSGGLQLGSSGTAETLTLGNATSGTVALGTVVGALGSVTASLPANTGIIAELNLAQTWSGQQSFAAVTATSMLATGNVDGTAPITVTTGTTATLGGTFKSGYTWNQEATAATAVAYTLPTAAAGLQYCVGNGWNGTASTTGVLTVNSSASGQFIIFTDGTLSATGGNVTSGGAAADMACFVGVDATHWQFSAIRGTWAKH